MDNPAAPEPPPQPPSGPVNSGAPRAVPGRGRRRVRAAVAVVVLLLVVWCGVRVYSWVKGEPFPVADPDRTARALQDHSQEIYLALALPAGRTEVSGNRLMGLECDPRDWTMGFEADPDPVPGVVQVQHTWDVTGLSTDQARTAISQAVDALVADGWHLETRRDEPGYFLTVLLTRDDHTSALEWVHRDQVLEVVTTAPCGRAPEESRWYPLLNGEWSGSDRDADVTWEPDSPRPPD
ncbi:hypothetical protein [Streptomyces specialis]|uniref:hypothetical protein n=1 Tax=Streptomyces specialis TaxID=498367 RepID=UPI00131BF638|nr:hypothetical protein [Streptomyces specialis]